MSSIYVIVGESFKNGDIETSWDVDFVTTEKDVALEYFDNLKDFCLGTKNSNWCYRYLLYEYYNSTDRHTRKLISGCDNW